MRVTIRLFAAQREAVGAGLLDVQLPDGASAADAYAQLCREYPALSHAASSVAFAVNREHVAPDARLANGDELAFLPPVAGG